MTSENDQLLVNVLSIETNFRTWEKTRGMMVNWHNEEVENTNNCIKDYNSAVKKFQSKYNQLIKETKEDLHIAEAPNAEQTLAGILKECTENQKIERKANQESIQQFHDDSMKSEHQNMVNDFQNELNERVHNDQLKLLQVLRKSLTDAESSSCLFKFKRG